VCEFFMGDQAEGALGEAVGWLAGTIAFEVLLGILTAGAWQPVSAAGKALKALARILDWTGEALGAAFRLPGRIGGLLMDALRGLGRMLASAGGGMIGRRPPVDTPGRTDLPFRGPERHIGEAGSAHNHCNAEVVLPDGSILNIHIHFPDPKVIP
jgi:hypothetical protein